MFGTAVGYWLQAREHKITQGQRHQVEDGKHPRAEGFFERFFQLTSGPNSQVTIYYKLQGDKGSSSNAKLPSQPSQKP